MQPINQIRFNDNKNMWDTGEFMIAEQDTVTGKCACTCFFHPLCQSQHGSNSVQIFEQHQSKTPVSNTSCAYRELTLLYCLLLSLPSNFELREIRDPQMVINQRNCMLSLATIVAAQVPAMITQVHWLKVLHLYSVHINSKLTERFWKAEI